MLSALIFRFSLFTLSLSSLPSLSFHPSCLPSPPHPLLAPFNRWAHPIDRFQCIFRIHFPAPRWRYAFLAIAPRRWSPSSRRASRQLPLDLAISGWFLTTQTVSLSCSKPTVSPFTQAETQSGLPVLPGTSAPAAAPFSYWAQVTRAALLFCKHRRPTPVMLLRSSRYLEWCSASYYLGAATTFSGCCSEGTCSVRSNLAQPHFSLSLPLAF